MLQTLAQLGARAGAVTETVYVPAGTAGVSGWEGLPPSAASGSGLVLLSGPGLRVAITPPFPPDEGDGLPPGGRRADGLDAGPLRSALTRSRLVAVVLLRLGAYAVGVVEDGRLVESKTGARYVGSRHRAGGQSQRRFERGRAGQTRRLYDRACETARSRIEPFAQRLDALALGGDRHVIGGFLKRCAFVGDLDRRLHTVRVQVHRPGMRALERTCATIWDSTVWTLEGSNPRTLST